MFSFFSRQAQQVVSQKFQFLRFLLDWRRPAARRSLLRTYDKMLQDDLREGERNLSIENFFLTPEGIVVIYHLVDKHDQIRVFLQLFETLSVHHSLLKNRKELYTIGSANDGWKFLRLIDEDGHYQAYWLDPQGVSRMITYPRYLVHGEVALRHPLPSLFKPKTNPMLSPHPKNDWESFCTFNPAALLADEKVHLLYRAQGFDYVSQIGYAASEDGLSIDLRHPKPAYRPTQPFEGVSLPAGDPENAFVSGGSCGGCEDPRATIIDDRVYMTYVAYNGWDHPRIALTSLSLKDFLAQKFLWEKPVLISRPGIVDKSACIFPEKINGKYVILHRVFPNILIDYVDSLDFTGENFLEGHAKIEPRSREWWDSRKIGAGAPPLKTKDGWLLIYQAVDDKDASQYKVGAMLLDLNDPSKVLFRSAKPILEPVEEYENFGFKAGVVYPCGAVIKDDTLFVYYGGADSFVCVATAPLEEFLNNLKKTGHAHLDAAMIAHD